MIVFVYYRLLSFGFKIFTSGLCYITSCFACFMDFVESLGIVHIHNLFRGRFAKHGEYQFQIVHMISEIFLFYSFILLVLFGCHPKRGLIDFIRQDSIFSVFFYSSLFPFVSKRMSDCNASFPFLYPVFWISFFLVKLSHPLHSEFRVIYFLYPFVSDFR